MHEFTVGVIFFVILLLFSLYYYSTKNYNYWSDQNVIGPKPVFFFGNTLDVVLGRINVADFIKSIYDAYPNEPVIGIFARSTPVLIVRDPAIIEDVLIKNFENFSDRGIKIYEDIDPLSQNLILSEPTSWKHLRTILLPGFTSKKLKELFLVIHHCRDKFIKHLEKLAANEKPVEYRDFTSKFTTDVIGFCAFGLNEGHLYDDGNTIKEFKKTLEISEGCSSKYKVKSLIYWMNRLLKSVVRDEKIIEFHIPTLQNEMNHRKKKKIRKNDFLDLLIDIINSSDLDRKSKDKLAAQIYVFFVAGFQTACSTISNALYELATNLDYQEKLRNEIRLTTNNNEKNITFDNFGNMKFLEKVIKETLRLYPPAFLLPRVAIKNHTFVNSGISITKGTKVIIPVYPIHYDPKIFSNPGKFNPDRFEEEHLNRQSLNYLPFGNGLRSCIGKHFAKLYIKIAVTTALQYFRFEVCEESSHFSKNVSSKSQLSDNSIHLRIINIQ